MFLLSVVLLAGCSDDPSGDAEPEEFRELADDPKIPLETEIDPNDPNMLQVPAPEGKEQWVIDGANALHAAANLDPTPMSIVENQRLFVLFARSHSAVVATVESAALDAEVGLVKVGFAVGEVLLGEPPDHVEVRMLPDDLCAPPPPKLGTTHLLSLDKAGGLRIDGAMEIADDQLKLQSSSIPIAALSAALAEVAS